MPSKPKINRSEGNGKAGSYDSCQTPAYALEPLAPYIPQNATIWEPAAGEGLLVDGLRRYWFDDVIASDIITGQDFFKWQPERFWTHLITNPPYSHPMKPRWIMHTYEFDKPFALLVPVETLGGQDPQDMIEQFPGTQIMLLDKRIDFKMPMKGFEGSGAQFPVLWWTYGMKLPRDLTVGHITSKPSRRSKPLLQA